MDTEQPNGPASGDSTSTAHPTPGVGDGAVGAEPSRERNPDGTWRGKHNERVGHYQAIEQRADQAAKAAEELRAQLDSERGERTRMAEALARLEGRMQERHGAEEGDRFAQDIDKMEERIKDAWARQDFDGGRRLERQMYEMIADRRTADAIKKFQESQPKRDPRWEAVERKHPELTDPTFKEVAGGHMRILVARGQPDNDKTLAEAVRRAKVDMGDVAASPSSDAERRLYGGRPSTEVPSEGARDLTPTQVEIEAAERAGVPVEALMATIRRNHPGRR